MHIHSLRLAAVAAAAVVLVSAVPALAESVTTQLRVEAGGRDIGPGWHYVHDSVTYSTSQSAACNGSGDSGSIDGPSALGLLVQAADYSRPLQPVQISDQFDFGPFVCGVGEHESSTDGFWLYKVDHVSPEVGAHQFPITEDHDTVLWYFVNNESGSNTGDELELVGPPPVIEVGQPVKVTVNEYDFAGKASPAVGVRILGTDAVTGADGTATLVFEEEGRTWIRGIRGTDVPTDAVGLCIWEDGAKDCDGFVADRVVGTNGPDRFAGTGRRERLIGRRGRDRFNSRGDNLPDQVRCGRGRDRVLADRHDVVADTCEVVRRK
ncbi:MAG TPA: hypothetical protein VD790_03885 [Thermoleophilaceae bacterium]|nr:hypothetical protein [Thermoleophilaceae bacterium]